MFCIKLGGKIFLFIYVQCTIGKVPTLSELEILRYTDDGEEKTIHITRSAACKWKEIAAVILGDPSKMNEIAENNNRKPADCLRQTFIDGFIRNKPKNYSRDWQGLIHLLKDVELEVLADEIQRATTITT